MDWRHRAICRDEDPELFFPVAETGPRNLLQIAEAKTVCRRCPASAECLLWAVDTGQEFGVWGGMTESERRALRAPDARRRARETAPQRHAAAVVTTPRGSERMYATCPVCTRRQPRRVHGEMVRHDQYAEGPGWSECGGSGQQPAPDRVDASA